MLDEPPLAKVKELSLVGDYPGAVQALEAALASNLPKETTPFAGATSWGDYARSPEISSAPPMPSTKRPKGIRRSDATRLLVLRRCCCARDTSMTRSRELAQSPRGARLRQGRDCSWPKRFD